MNIVMFGQKRIPSREGGVEIVVEELATRMAKMGHNVICYNRAGHHVSGKEYDAKGCNYYRGVIIEKVWTIDKKGLAAFSSSIVAAWKAMWSNADVVHIHAEGPAAVCLLPKLRGKRVIVTIHGLDWQRAKWGGLASKYIKWGEKQAARFSDEIIVLSKNVQDYFMKEYGRKTVFIPNGIDVPNIQEVNMIKEKFGLEKNEYILYLGRIVPEKGIQYLLEAWSKLKTDMKLVIAGGASDTDLFAEELKKNTDSVIWTGFVQGRMLEELYSNAYIYCLPSDLEGMPLSLLEAMSYGNCCLVSDIDECVSVVEDKAVVFKQGDVIDLKNKLRYLIDNKEVVKKYKEEAASYICKKYNWNDVVKNTINLYNGD